MDISLHCILTWPVNSFPGVPTMTTKTLGDKVEVFPWLGCEVGLRESPYNGFLCRHSQFERKQAHFGIGIQFSTCCIGAAEFGGRYRSAPDSELLEHVRYTRYPVELSEICVVS